MTVANSIETHYDTLNVTRTAPREVIKASSRVLSQKYHPDRNTDPAALQRMIRINAAWDVLSDAQRRATHDRWIDSQTAGSEAPAPQARPDPGVDRPAMPLPASWHPRHILIAATVVVVILLLALSLFNLMQAARIDAPAPRLTQEPVVQSAGQPWKERPWEAVSAERMPHGYLAKDVQTMSEGRSSVEIDNVAGTQDAEVRLYRNGRVTRSMMVHAGQRFLVEKLAPGSYVLKYKVLSDGKMHAYQANAVLELQQDAERRDKFSSVRVALADLARDSREIGLEQM